MLSRCYRMLAVVYAFSGTPLSISSYAQKFRGKCCVKCRVYESQQGLLRRVRRICCGLFSSLFGEHSRRYRGLEFAHTPTSFANNGRSCVADICFADSDQVMWLEPHTAGMTYCLFCSLWYAWRGRQSRPIRLEKISAFFHLCSPLRRRRWQSLAMGRGCDRIQPAEYQHSSAAGFRRHGPIHDWVLVAQAAKQVVGLVSSLGRYASRKGCCQSLHMPATLPYLRRRW